MSLLNCVQRLSNVFFIFENGIKINCSRLSSFSFIPYFTRKNSLARRASDADCMCWYYCSREGSRRQERASRGAGAMQAVRQGPLEPWDERIPERDTRNLLILE